MTIMLSYNVLHLYFLALVRYRIPTVYRTDRTLPEREPDRNLDNQRPQRLRRLHDMERVFRVSPGAFSSTPQLFA